MLIIISGVTSYGKPVMLEALKKGGVNILDDHINNSYSSIPCEICEYEKIDHIINNESGFDKEDWAVSLGSVQLKKLPPNGNYIIIFIDREIEDIISSNENLFDYIILKKKNLILDRLKRSFIESHTNRVKKWLAHNPNFNTIFIDYHSLANNPVETINDLNTRLKLYFNIDNSLSVV